MIRWLLALFLLVASSADAQPRGIGGGTISEWGKFNFTPDDGLTRGPVAGAPDAVYSVLKTILTDLGVPVPRQDSAGRQLVGERQRVVRRMGKASVSRYLSCGHGLTGPNADSWHVYLDVAARITGGGDQSQFQFNLTGNAIDVPGGRAERVACTTTGRLELEIIQRLRAAFPGSG